MSKVMEPMSTDKIAGLSDDELRKRIKGVQSEIYHARKDSRSTRDLEIEFCYYVREQEVRENRRSAHSKFVAARDANRKRGRYNTTRDNHNHGGPRRVTMVSK